MTEPTPQSPVTSGDNTFDLIALLYHPKIPRSQELAAEMKGFLEAEGISVWMGSHWDEAAVAAEAHRLDMFIVLGGDGSMLRAARMGAEHGIPILGVNMGRLGFLAEVAPEDWKAA